jgi:hypothetical protein
MRALTPSVVKRLALTAADVSRDGLPSASMFTALVTYAPTSWNERFRSRNSRYSGGETQN